MVLIKKLLVLSALLTAAAFSWLLNFRYENVDISKISYSFLAIAVSFFVFKFLLEGIASPKIKDAKMRYSFRKTMQLLFIIVSCIVVLRIWIINPQALLVAYGLVGAGMAIALQDVFKNFAGAIALFLTSPYRIGDRIEIGGTHGDVIDIGLFYTNLLELRGWVNGDQATGRIVIVPNGQVLSSHVYNYTKDHAFIWDEFMLPITYDSNWQKASEIIKETVVEETKKFTAQAEREITHLGERYYVSKRNTETNVFLVPTDNWISFYVRYVTEVRERRVVQNKLMHRILEEMNKYKDIHIASSTLTITRGKL